jgi:bifunctional non-homologous end joining protein LigD
MLATSGPLPSGPGWAYEFKWDGVRALAGTAHGRLRMRARSGAEITAGYPELAGLARQVPDAEFDGEILLLGPEGRPSFTALAERMHVREPARAARLAALRPVTYMIFDVLRLGDEDLTGQEYAVRRARLEGLGLGGAHWLVPPSFADGPATLAAATEYALEGVVAKRLNSRYHLGLRSTDWVKVKLEATGDFVVGGWRPGAGPLGALLVGVPAGDGRLDYRGRVGGGISGASERALLSALSPLVVARSPFTAPLAREDAKDATWVRPAVVVEVRYGQQTPDGRLRFPRFVRLRPDKTPGEADG